MFKYLLLLSLIINLTLSYLPENAFKNDYDDRHDLFRHKKRSPEIKRPENGTGTILISYENITKHINEKRILIVFDLVCVNNINESDTKLMAKIGRIRQQYAQCLNLCPLSQSHYDSNNYSYVWMDLMCPLAVIQQKTNISIDYDELCIEYIMYEPVFNVSDIPIISSKISTPTPNTTEPGHQCNNISTTSDIRKSYGLDLLDSPWLDGRYSYVDMDTLRDGLNLDLFILDTGIQSDHIEFEEGQVIHIMGSGPATIQSNSGTLYSDHGTHVAGIMGGRNYGSSRGITIYDYRVCEYNNDFNIRCYGSLIMAALRSIELKLRDNPTRRGVINLSFGGQKRSDLPVDLTYYSDYFDKIRSYGGIPVVAAGNEDQDACKTRPAYSNNAITVGAFDINRNKAWFSNWGNCVDIWGPGDSIWSSIASETNDKYGYLSGTSMASPMIAGIVANLLAIQPTLSFDGIKNALKNNYSEIITSGKCNEYECRAPVYSCGQRIYGDAISLPSDDDMTMMVIEITLIIIGAILLVVIIIIIILCLRNKR